MHPLWEEYLQERCAQQEPKNLWDHLRAEAGMPKPPEVPQWVPCDGVDCGHPENLLFMLSA